MMGSTRIYKALMKFDHFTGWALTWALSGADNAVVDAIKLILLIYNNFSIIKKVVNKIERVK